jgi:EAL domain-containing protein (putative c-di-GMP-specific phosphodiesterase class I)
MSLLSGPQPGATPALSDATPAPPPRRVVVAGLGSGSRLASGLAVLIDKALPAAQRAEVRLADPADAEGELTGSPDLVVLGPAADARAWLAAARRGAPNARRILVADSRDTDAARLARRNGAALVSLAGDGAAPIAELAARCAEQLRADAGPRRRRGPEPGSRTAEQRRRAADLARALRCGELTLHYQPCVDLRSGRVLGVEALARWPHPGFGNIPPNDFIPVAEKSGLILELGAWALSEAAREAASWPNRALRMAVNVSPRQIEAGVVAAQVRNALRESRLEPHRLSIEITEGAVIETSEATIEALRGVRDMGVAIALDDFGTGYASLAAARRLPITTLKIDRSFVAGLGADPEDLAIVRAMADMARSLNLSLVAEGIETDIQRVTLIGLGITEGQGWLFGRPSPAAALARHLKG